MMNHRLKFVLLILLATVVTSCGFARVVTSGDYTLASGEILRGDLLVTSGQVTLETGSRVTGRVVVTSGAVDVDGEIDGDLVITSGDVRLGPEAIVRGSIIMTSGNLAREDGARVEGDESATAGIGALIAGTALAGCILPLVLVAVVIGAIFFLVIGGRRRRRAVVGAPDAGSAEVEAGKRVSESAVTMTDSGSQSVEDVFKPERHTQDAEDTLRNSTAPPRATVLRDSDRYEILEKIGEGGFATVYRARDKKLDRLVALKELRSILLQDTGWVKRFRREAQTIARLDHPRIVTIHDVYETHERLFIVMRLVDGPGLDEHVARQGRLPWPEAVQIITAIAEGLDYAHSQGILHRDLKPANILLDSERGPLLSDFGLAKLVGENSLSTTGDIVGTPHYIAPEVWDGQGATHQSDIYALGCILYEMLTGEKVFKGETPPQVMMAHFSPLTLPEVWPESVPPGVAEALKTATAREPGNRYATAGEMAQSLANLA